MFLNVSMDGVNWEQSGSNNTTYHGGLTEVGFHFDLEVCSPCVMDCTNTANQEDL